MPPPSFHPSSFHVLRLESLPTGCCVAASMVLSGSNRMSVSGPTLLARHTMLAGVEIVSGEMPAHTVLAARDSRRSLCRAPPVERWSWFALAADRHSARSTAPCRSWRPARRHACPAWRPGSSRRRTPRPCSPDRSRPRTGENLSCSGANFQTIWPILSRLTAYTKLGYELSKYIMLPTTSGWPSCPRSVPVDMVHATFSLPAFWLLIWFSLLCRIPL